MSALENRILGGEHQLVLERLQEVSTRMPVYLVCLCFLCFVSCITHLYCIAMLLFVSVYRTGLSHGLLSWRRWSWSQR